MAMITLGEAARLTGLGKTTLARAIKAGRLSATRTDIGTYQIDPAELGRVYPFPAPSEAAGGTGEATPDADTDETPGATAALEAQIAGLREVGQLLRAQLYDVRDDRERWRSQAERLALPGPVTHAARAGRAPWWWRAVG